MNWRERIYCGDLDSSCTDRTVLLMGWVDAIRDHGHLLFIHLRDIKGIVQVVFDIGTNRENYNKALSFKEEYVIQVAGRVAQRAEGTENPNLRTGEIEVFAEDLLILSASKTPPFQISEKAMVFDEELRETPQSVDEDHRLQYRYLDLRRPSVQNLFVKRYNIIKCIRDYLHVLNFIEIETPLLTKSTPEGARDYLVPSRVHQNKFYALPQSPQLFKQLFMIGGMDRYFQIARCFRDEDLRPNRQPEFTQLDIEASFIDEDFIYEVTEKLIIKMFAFGDIALNGPFPRFTYNEVMERYGTDRPDLRFDMAFKNITDIFQDTDYSIFRQVIDGEGHIKGFCIKGKASILSKNVLQNEYAKKIVPSLGGKGMTWMKMINGRLESNIVQFLSSIEQKEIIERFQVSNSDVVIMVADTSLPLVNTLLCGLRLHFAERLKLIPEDLFCPLWVTEFPLFEVKDGRVSSQHHPFTMPDKTDFNPLDRDELLGLSSRSYDLVVNGEELGGGSIRINRMDIQRKIFQALGLGPEEIEAKFGFFLGAFEYGAPPHGGLALGIDRVVAMILKTQSIREVIAFPKNRSALCPLTRAPSPVSRSQLKELGLVAGTGGEVTKKKVKLQAQSDVAEDNLSQQGRISRDKVKYVAKLARLKLSDSDVDLYRKDLNSILTYADTLQEQDTEKIDPMSHVLEIMNVWRDDKPGKNKERESLLSNAPLKEKNYYKVPKILEG